ncbi:MAG: DNA polymerase III subunit delta [Thermacetogeniaceae bacterium]
MPLLTYYDARRRLEKGELPSLLLLQGEDRFLQREIIMGLRRCLERGYGYLDWLELEGASAEAEIRQMLAIAPFGSGKRLLVLHDTPAAAVEAYLEAASPSTVLVLIPRERLQPSHKAFRLLVERGWVVDCSPLRGKDLVRWIAEEARFWKKEISPSAAEYLRFVCGDQLERMCREIEKASLYLGDDGRTITTEVLKEICSFTHQRSVFELASAVADGKTDLVREILSEISAKGEPPVLVVTLLSRYFLQLLEMACLLEEGVRPQKLPEAMGIQVFLARRMYQQLRSLSMEKLEWIIDCLLDLDVAIKQGRGNPQLLLESGVVEISLKIKKPLTLQGKRWFS